MKEIDKSYLIKKINKLNKKIHRSESQENDNKTWWRKMKLKKLTRIELSPALIVLASATSKIVSSTLNLTTGFVFVFAKAIAKLGNFFVRMSNIKFFVNCSLS